MKKNIKSLFTCLIMFVTFNSFSQKPCAVVYGGVYRGQGGFLGGYQSAVHPFRGPDCWVRGKCNYDPKTGKLHVDMQLETNDIKGGPKGSLKIDITDCNDSLIVSIVTPLEERGGKKPGKAQKTHFSFDYSIDSKYANRVHLIYTNAEYIGYKFRLFDAKWDDVQHVIGLVTTAISYF